MAEDLRGAASAALSQLCHAAAARAAATLPRIIAMMSSAARAEDHSMTSTTPEIAPPPPLDAALADPVFDIDSLSLWYGSKQALHDISLRIPQKRITAFIGPSGCGKSTLIRCLNRLNDLVPTVRIEGDIRFEGSSIF